MASIYNNDDNKPETSTIKSALLMIDFFQHRHVTAYTIFPPGAQ